MEKVIKTRKKRAGGRPRFEFTEDRLKAAEALAKIACTDEEIAEALGCSQDTLARGRARCPELDQALNRGRAAGRRSLRRKQYEMAMMGHPTMLVWLGKQLLMQRDKQDVSLESSAPPPFVVMFESETGTEAELELNGE